MTNFYEYLLQFLPILIGGVMMLALKSLRLAKNKVTIDTFAGTVSSASSELGTETKEVTDRSMSWKGYICESDDAAEAMFEEILRGDMIVNCLFGTRSGPAGTKPIALSKLGIGDLKTIDLMDSKWEGQAPLRLFVRNGSDLLSSLMKPGKRSGLLLAYMADSRLELFGVGNELHRKYD